MPCRADGHDNATTQKLTGHGVVTITSMPTKQMAIPGVAWIFDPGQGNSILFHKRPNTVTIVPSHDVLTAESLQLRLIAKVVHRL